VQPLYQGLGSGRSERYFTLFAPWVCTLVDVALWNSEP
jgi:hypothetical protein